MADLEEHAFRRDRGFVVRLVLVVAVASLAAILVWGFLTGGSTSSCAAQLWLGSDVPAK